MNMSEIERRSLGDELYSCAQCGYCQDVCPVYDVISWESASPRGKLYWIKRILTRGFLRTRVEVDDAFVNRLFQCTLCGRCHEVCQTSLDTLKIWNTARAEVHLSGRSPGNLTLISENLKGTRNPYGLDADMRLDWADFTGLDDLPLKEKADTAYFVGCTTAFKGANHRTAHATALLLNHLGEDWTLLGEDEWCCGGPLLMAGDEEGAREFARHNIEELQRRGVKTLLTGCPTCYRMWETEIPELIGGETGFTVVHTMEYLAEKLLKGEIAPSTSKERISYHDPCELSRLCGVVEEPRTILNALSSGFVEMPEHGRDTRCCGGGGLLQASDDELRISIAGRRLEQALGLGVNILTSACPACNQTLLDAQRSHGGELKIVDLVEYLVDRLGLE